MNKKIIVACLLAIISIIASKDNIFAYPGGSNVIPDSLKYNAEIWDITYEVTSGSIDGGVVVINMGRGEAAPYHTQIISKTPYTCTVKRVRRSDGATHTHKWTGTLRRSSYGNYYSSNFLDFHVFQYSLACPVIEMGNFTYTGGNIPQIVYDAWSIWLYGDTLTVINERLSNLSEGAYVSEENLPSLDNPNLQVTVDDYNVLSDYSIRQDLPLEAKGNGRIYERFTLGVDTQDITDIQFRVKYKYGLTGLIGNIKESSEVLSNVWGLSDLQTWDNYGFFTTSDNYVQNADEGLSIGQIIFADDVLLTKIKVQTEELIPEGTMPSWFVIPFNKLVSGILGSGQIVIDSESFVYQFRAVKGREYGSWTTFNSDMWDSFNPTSGSALSDGTNFNWNSTTGGDNPIDTSGNVPSARGDSVNQATAYAYGIKHSQEYDLLDDSLGEGTVSFKTAFNHIKDAMQYVLNMPKIIAALFGFLPPWCLQLTAVGFSSIVLLAIYKLIRG